MMRLTGRFSGVSRLRAVLSIMAMGLVALSVSACGGSSSVQSGGSGGAAGGKQLRVAVLYTGASATIDEYARAWQGGIQGAADAVGAGSVKIDDVTGVQFGDSGLQTVQRLIGQKYDIIIDTLDLTGLDKVCAKAPKVACMTFTPPLSTFPKNVSGFDVFLPQSFYLEGVAAGMLSKTGVIGHVGSVEVPFQKAYINAMALGCRKVRPNCQVKVVYVNAYFDPPKAQQAAQSLLNAGADVINAYQDDPTPVRVAGRHNVWSFGIYDSMEKFDPNRYVATMQLEPSIQAEVTRVFKTVAKGVPNGPGKIYDLAAGLKPLSGWGAHVPQAVKDRVAKEQQELTDGASIFKGPLMDTAGKVRVPAGKTVDGGAVYDLDFYVKGVQR